MIIRSLMHWLALAVVVAAAPATLAASQGGMDYAAGGIGDGEMQQLQAREKEFNLKLVFTLVEGNYVSDVAVVVKDKSGKAVLTLASPGPLVLARVPRGSYMVEANYKGKVQTHTVEVGERLRTEYLRWPSNPETDPEPKSTER